MNILVFVPFGMYMRMLCVPVPWLRRPLSKGIIELVNFSCRINLWLCLLIRFAVKACVDVHVVHHEVVGHVVRVVLCSLADYA